MTDYTCTNGHDKCNEMHASDTCPYCVSAVKSPKPWIVERDAVGTPVMIRDAEGHYVCLNDGYDQLGPDAEVMLDIVKAVNYHEELVDVLEALVCVRERTDFDKAETLWDKISEESEK